MPYSHRKVGDKNCVYKADTGKKVGCTKGSVKKYLAALHANVPDAKNESKCQSCGGDGWDIEPDEKGNPTQVQCRSCKGQGSHKDPEPNLRPSGEPKHEPFNELKTMKPIKLTEIAKKVMEANYGISHGLHPKARDLPNHPGYANPSTLANATEDMSDEEFANSDLVPSNGQSEDTYMDAVDFEQNMDANNFLNHREAAILFQRAADDDRNTPDGIAKSKKKVSDHKKEFFRLKKAKTNEGSFDWRDDPQLSRDFEKSDVSQDEFERSRGFGRYGRGGGYSPKPKMVGITFFNVPNGKEEEARRVGLTQFKSGKWGFKHQFDKNVISVASDREKSVVSGAEQSFGKGRYWEPRN